MGQCGRIWLIVRRACEDTESCDARDARGSSTCGGMPSNIVRACSMHDHAVLRFLQ